VAAVARILVTGSGARPSRLREVRESESRPESALLHFRAAEALVLASLPLGHTLEPLDRIVAGGIVSIAKEET
jgi:hypothetical protein